jgi:hypothetical protein
MKVYRISLVIYFVVLLHATLSQRQVSIIHFTNLIQIQVRAANLDEVHVFAIPQSNTLVVLNFVLATLLT